MASGSAIRVSIQEKPTRGVQPVGCPPLTTVDEPVFPSVVFWSVEERPRTRPVAEPVDQLFEGVEQEQLVL